MLRFAFVLFAAVRGGVLRNAGLRESAERVDRLKRFVGRRCVRIERQIDRAERDAVHLQRLGKRDRVGAGLSRSAPRTEPVDAGGRIVRGDAHGDAAALLRAFEQIPPERFVFRLPERVEKDAGSSAEPRVQRRHVAVVRGRGMPVRLVRRAALL